MKKTKIITSIGPSSSSPEVFEKMVEAGANVARINFSHATLEEKETVVATVKKVRELTGKNIAILYDTKGPEFRSGRVENGEILLEEGKQIKIVKEDTVGTSEHISVNHPNALDNLQVGSIILIENGLMKVQVIEKLNNGVNCLIISGGMLGNKKSLSVPGVNLDIPFISDNDREDLVYACNHEADFIALSFVNTKEDVLEAKKILKQNNREDIKIISKIESMTGIENLEEIVEVSDGIMVARGDLGVEVPMPMLPIYQKKIIRLCREHSKIAVVATEMLESMKKSIRPTRAEVSDVANAVLDGTDAVMLSGETTTGKYPVETVKYMADICENAENFYKNKFNYNEKIGITESISESAVKCSDILGSKAIVVSSVSGYTARKISNLKPKADILAVCTTSEVARSLSLNYGVNTDIIPVYENTDKVISECTKCAIKKFNLKENDKIVITGGLPVTSPKRRTNFIKIEEID